MSGTRMSRRLARKAKIRIVECIMTRELTGNHLIEGKWVGGGGEKFTATNPATGESLPPEINEAADAQVQAAASAADQAFLHAADLHPGWSAKLLDAIAEQIMNLGD